MRLPTWIFVVLALFAVVGLAGSVAAQEEAKDETAKGTIKSVNADKKEVVVTDKDKKDMTFTLDDAGKIKLADKDIKLNELKAGDEVEIKYTKKGDKMMAKEIKATRK